MGTALETPQGATPSPDNGFQTTTLAVTPGQAKMLTMVDLNATLRLSLRGSGDVSHRPMLGEKLDLTGPPRSRRSVRSPPRPLRRRGPAAAPVKAGPDRRQARRPERAQIISGDKVLR